MLSLLLTNLESFLFLTNHSRVRRILHETSKANKMSKRRQLLTIEFDPSITTFPSFPYPFFERETPERFFFKLHREETDKDGNCMFQALSLGFYEKKKHWRTLKKKMLNYVQGLNNIEVEKLFGNHIACRKSVCMCTCAQCVIDVLKTEGKWGFLDHFTVFEKAYNAAVWTWTKKGDTYQVHRRPQIDNNTMVPKFIHLLHEGGESEENNNHWTHLRRNTMYAGKIKRLAADLSSHEQCPPTVLETTDDEEDDIEIEIEEDLHEEDTVPIQRLTRENVEFHDHLQHVQTENLEDSFTSSQQSTNSSHRPSNKEYQDRLMQVDFLQMLSTELGSRGTCCAGNCFQIRRNDDGYFSLQSDVFERPIEELLHCRQWCKKLSQKDRSTFAENMYRNGMEKSGKAEKYNFNLFVLLENETRPKVCMKSFNICYGISKSMSLRIRKRLNNEGLGSVTKKQIDHFVSTVGRETPESTHLSMEGCEIIAFIRDFCEGRGEMMPHLDQVRISFPKNIVYQAYVEQNKKMGKTKIPDKGYFYRLWNEYCADITKCRWKGDFAICDVCKKCAQVDANPYNTQEIKRNNKHYMRRHLKTCEMGRLAYAYRRQLAIAHPSTYLSIIIDGCDSNMTTLPNIKTMSKGEDKYRQYLLKHRVMGVRVHGLRKRDYLYMAPPFLGKAVGSNYTIEALARTLIREEDLRLSTGVGWPDTLFLQMDNTSKDNKNQYVFAYLTHLVDQGIFKTIYVSFLLPGHTHEDIDQCFSVLSRALRREDAYTFDQWENLVNRAFVDEFNKIYRVEYVWSCLDYKKWLSQATQEAYKDYRSTAYHFRIRKLAHDKPAITQYTRFCYEGDLYNPEPRYFPDLTTTTAHSFLSNILVGFPITDETAGTWLEKSKASDKDGTETNVELWESKINELLRLETNHASEEDVDWWRNFWKNKPTPGTMVLPYQTWVYKLPDVSKVKDGCTAANMDVFDLRDAKPLSPFKHEMLITANWSRTARRDAIKLAENYGTMHIAEEIAVRSFVIFKVDQPGWGEIGKTQQGIHPDCLCTEFGLGEVVAVENEDEMVKEISVHIWYAVDAGDPNGKWAPWLRKSDNPNEKKATPWIIQILPAMILLAGVVLSKGKLYAKLTLGTKKSIHQHPDISYGLLPGYGLVPQSVERMTLEERVLQTKGGRSKQALREHKIAQTKLLKSKQQNHFSNLLQQKRKRQKLTYEEQEFTTDVQEENLEDTSASIQCSQDCTKDLQSPPSPILNQESNITTTSKENKKEVREYSATHTRVDRFHHRHQSQ